MKVSWQQAEYLIMIGDNSEGTDGKGTFWVPPNGYKHSHSETLGRDLYVDGSGVAQTLKALERKGLIRFHTLTRYSSSITEEGRKLIEHWRETDSWPVKVAV